MSGYAKVGNGNSIHFVHSDGVTFCGAESRSGNGNSFYGRIPPRVYRLEKLDPNRVVSFCKRCEKVKNAIENY